MTVFRLCPTCGATLDPRKHGHRGHAGGAGGNATSNAPGNNDGRSGAAENGVDSEPRSPARQDLRYLRRNHRLQVHHRIALADGGTNQLSNLELRCETHHKHAPAKSRSSTPPHREAQEQRNAVSLNADGMDV
jgi:hypothetical protein